ncbi:MAG TPA: Wzz/FepE/Etk N-terminal domain-containing protein, partial [Candidatus Methylomirabilis sp.]|nr:Wzz/FepE/Etk N-terminal domain-containing protein [Candidatus Methylomirabilis sp.]
MEERRQPSGEEDAIDLGHYFAILRSQWWKIALLSLAVGVITLLVMLRVPNSYKATAIITPVGDEGLQPNVSYLSALGISK